MMPEQSKAQDLSLWKKPEAFPSPKLLIMSLVELELKTYKAYHERCETETKKSQPDPHSLAETRLSVITGGGITGDFGGATQRNHDEVVLKRFSQKKRQG
jgi:hypothetical protein